MLMQNPLVTDGKLRRNDLHKVWQIIRSQDRKPWFPEWAVLTELSLWSCSVTSVKKTISLPMLAQGCPLEGHAQCIEHRLKVRTVCVWALALPLPGSSPEMSPKFSELLVDNKARKPCRNSVSRLQSIVTYKEKHIDSLLGFCLVDGIRNLRAKPLLLNISLDILEAAGRRT